LPRPRLRVRVQYTVLCTNVLELLRTFLELSVGRGWIESIATPAGPLSGSSMGAPTSLPAMPVFVHVKRSGCSTGNEVRILDLERIFLETSTSAKAKLRLCSDATLHARQRACMHVGKRSSTHSIYDPGRSIQECPVVTRLTNARHEFVVRGSRVEPGGEGGATIASIPVMRSWKRLPCPAGVNAKQITWQRQVGRFCACMVKSDP